MKLTLGRIEEILSEKTLMGGLKYAFRGNGGAWGETDFDPIKGITESEDKEIREHWQTLPGSSSYYSALYSLKKRVMNQ